MENMEDLVKEALHNEISNYLEDYRFDGIIKEIIRSYINSEMLAQIKGKAKEMVDNLTDEVLKQEVIVNSGWETANYDNFEEFLKGTFKKELYRSWDIKSKIRDATQKIIEELINSKRDEAIEKIVDEMTKELGKEV